MRKIVFVLLLAVSWCAQPQTVYYCQKNGKQVITDSPCSNSGSVETRRNEDSVVVQGSVDGDMFCMLAGRERDRMRANQYKNGVPVDPTIMNHWTKEMEKHGCFGR